MSLSTEAEGTDKSSGVEPVGCHMRSLEVSYPRLLLILTLFALPVGCSDSPTSPPSVASVTVSPAEASLDLGDQQQFTATARDADGNVLSDREMIWSVSGPGSASINSAGFLTAEGPGELTVVAQSEGIRGEARVMVKDPPVASVEIDPDSVAVVVGSKVTLGAQVLDASGNELLGRGILWSSSDEMVASVDQEGAVAGHSPGDAVISATSEGVEGQATIQVTPIPVAAVVVDPGWAEVEVGETQELTATAVDGEGNPLEGRTAGWSSSDETVATVSESGVVTGLNVGAATIEAMIEGQVGYAEITVAPPPVASVVINPDSASVEVGEQFALTAIVRDSDGQEVQNRNVRWNTSDRDVVTVDGEGTFTGQGVGAAMITATSGGVSGQARVHVVPTNGLYLTLESDEPVDGFAVAIDGGSFGSDPRVVDIPAPDGFSGAAGLSIPSGGSYRVRAVGYEQGGGVSGRVVTTGQASRISVGDFRATEVPIQLSVYSVSVSIPDRVSGGEEITVSWTYSGVSDAVEDGGALRRPSGFIHYSTSPFSDGGGQTASASGERIAGGDYRISGTIQAPLQAGTIFLQVEGFTFANIFNSGLEGPLADFLDPSVSRSEELLTITVN